MNLFLVHHNPAMRAESTVSGTKVQTQAAADAKRNLTGSPNAGNTGRD